jgi:hypothetical protein
VPVGPLAPAPLVPVSSSELQLAAAAAPTTPTKIAHAKEARMAASYVQRRPDTTAPHDERRSWGSHRIARIAMLARCRPPAIS